jgi:hypothetical protein
MLTFGNFIAPARNGAWLLALLQIALVSLPSMYAQTSAPTAASAAMVQPAAIPSSARVLLAAQGDRLTTPGKERLTVQASMTDSNGSRTARIIWGMPGRFRYDETGGGKTIAFDSKAAASALSMPAAADLDLVETLFSDGAESFFENLGSGVAYRFLGYGFRADDGTTPSYTGPVHDIYQVLVPLTFRKDQTARPKFFYFDSRTRLLAKVRYAVPPSAGSTVVETVYSGWTQVNGQMLPGKIERSENGKITLSVTSQVASFSAAATDGVFSKP